MSEETYKIRIKYVKSGVLKYIGHLDLMRFFQKAFKRAGVDVAYSQGFSPHQLMSFAAPLALGVTSEGEYFDAQMNSLVSSEEYVRILNEQMVDGVYVKNVILLPEKAKKAMSIVAASDYIVSFKDDDDLNYQFVRDLNDIDNKESQKKSDYNKIIAVVPQLLKKDAIEVFRKTKKNEKVEDIKKGIYKLELREDKIYMFLATGSEYNLKPESVIEALCNEAGVPYNKYDYQIHRIETYYKNEKGQLASLLETGTKITDPMHN